MGGQEPKKAKKRICAALLAHVDAGKTTLSEGLLYVSGTIRKLGRVDKRDAFLDTSPLERERGITIFSKQAVFPLEELEVTLLDTPGHVDFSAEMERTLQVLDAAILVISGADGVQGHTQTLWKLLSRYQVPVFLFVNKMDQEGTDAKKLLEELKKRLDENCVDFSACPQAGEKSHDGKTAGKDGSGKALGGDLEAFYENIAMCDETVLEAFLEQGTVADEDIRKLILERKCFPCFFGSALKLTGVEEFLKGFERYFPVRSYPDAFGAKIYKISRDDQGNRLTYLKVTGGSLRVKDLLTNRRTAAADRPNREKNPKRTGETMPDREKNPKGTGGTMPNREKNPERTGNAYPEAAGPAEEKGFWEEKVNQIRIYSGAKYEAVEEVQAGTVCAVTGLTETFPGEGLGIEAESGMPILEPVLTYQIQLPPDCDVHVMLKNLRQLEEEEPMLHIAWNETLGEIHAQLMGEVQIEILKRLILERFHVPVEFGSGNIVYKETIADTVEGVGHFEPLRHYAEVHLILEPGEPGSGLQFASSCSEDVLDRNWQRLILTHLEEKEHAGVLTGSAITDMRITLASGRAHQKHTEGGDFRQATYRAVRQGLKKAEGILLEPYYDYRLEVPSDVVGRALSDLQRMQGTFGTPEQDGETAVLEGIVPVVTMRDYQTELAAYTKGRGRLFCSLKGYLPCHDPKAVIEKLGYDSERDTENPTGSVFCAHGAGFVVQWDQVEEYMHLDSVLRKKEGLKDPEVGTVPRRQPVRELTLSPEEERELDRMAEASRRKAAQAQKTISYAGADRSRDAKDSGRKSFTRTKKDSVSAQNRQAAEKKQEKRKEYLLVDGYNIIFAWEELRELAETNIDGARGKLMDVLSNYQGVKKCTVILVFDAYKLEGFPGEVQQYHNIYVVYTKEAETADQYIEKTAHEIGRKYHVTVATSDGTEQVIIRGQGCSLLSAKELRDEIELVNRELRREYLDRPGSGRNYLFDWLDAETAGKMEKVRLGKQGSK